MRSSLYDPGHRGNAFPLWEPHSGSPGESRKGRGRQGTLLARRKCLFATFGQEGSWEPSGGPQVRYSVLDESSGGAKNMLPQVFAKDMGIPRPGASKNLSKPSQKVEETRGSMQRSKSCRAVKEPSSTGRKVLVVSLSSPASSWCLRGFHWMFAIHSSISIVLYLFRFIYSICSILFIVRISSKKELKSLLSSRRDRGRSKLQKESWVEDCCLPPKVNNNNNN